MNIVSLGATGLQDWLLQRLTAVFLVGYLLFLSIYLCLHAPVDFFVWEALFNNTGMRIATLMVIVSTLIHTWLGLWMIITDYIKPVFLRVAVSSIAVFIMLGYLIWGITIVCRI